MGTGVIVYNDYKGGYLVLTAYHVVGEVKDIDISFGRTEPRYKGLVVKYDDIRDLALVYVRIKDRSITPSRTCSQAPQRFDEVVAVGAGLSLPLFPTTGIIANNDYRWSDHPEVHYLHHTAPIAPGNSGGPLYKLEKGHYCLQGINLRGYMGMDMTGRPIPISQFNFAIASDEIKAFINSKEQFRKAPVIKKNDDPIDNAL